MQQQKLTMYLTNGLHITIEESEEFIQEVLDGLDAGYNNARLVYINTPGGQHYVLNPDQIVLMEFEDVNRSTLLRKVS